MAEQRGTSEVVTYGETYTGTAFHIHRTDRKMFPTALCGARLMFKNSDRAYLEEQGWKLCKTCQRAFKARQKRNG